MLTAVNEIITAIVYVMQVVPIGTNLGLTHLMWAMLQGSFLKSRGAIHSGLQASGFEDDEISHSWSALHSGSWKMSEMLEQWHAYVASRNEWRERRYENFRVKSIDITGFWRPRLSGKLTKLYHALAQKALPAIVFGIIIRSGTIRGKRVPLLQSIVRCESGASERDFRKLLLQESVKQSAPDEITVMDAEFELSELHAAKVQRFVVRQANNCTARTNELPTADKPKVNKQGRPCEYGTLVRPLERSYGGKTIAATPAQKQGEFVFDTRTIRCESWHTLVTRLSKVNSDNPTFAIHVFHDPLYKKPLVLATDMELQPESIYLIYRDRWLVEHPPLATKQMIGLHRQFVFAPDSCFRLPELGLLTGNLLAHVAAMLPPMPSGFWDRTPKATPGRLRRVLAKAIFPNLTEFDPEVRKKNSVFDHLPKGVDAHRRQKAAA